MPDKSPFFVESKPLNRLDELRERLNRLESLLGGIEKAGLGDRALEIPELFDQVKDNMDELGAEGKLPPEEAIRFETVGAQLRSKAGAFLRAIGGARALSRARQEKRPDPDRWWWVLDQWVAEGKRQQVKRLLVSLLIGLAVLAGLWGLYRAFLAPSPQDEARYNYEGNADRLIMEGNLEGALQEIEKALVVAPDDPALLIRKGVLLHALGQAAESEAVFAQAESVQNDRREFLLARGQDWMSVGNYEGALADAQAILEIDPDSPEAYLIIGQAYELTGKKVEAIDAYEKAGSLADARNRPDLTALARIRLAYLMQQAP